MQNRHAKFQFQKTLLNSFKKYASSSIRDLQNPVIIKFVFIATQIQMNKSYLFLFDGHNERIYSIEFKRAILRGIQRKMSFIECDKYYHYNSSHDHRIIKDLLMSFVHIWTFDWRTNTNYLPNLFRRTYWNLSWATNFILESKIQKLCISIFNCWIYETALTWHVMRNRSQLQFKTT